MKKAMMTMAAIAVVGVAHADIYANLAAGFGISGQGSGGGVVNAIDGTAVVLQLIGGGGDGLAPTSYYLPGTGFVMGASAPIPNNDTLIATLTAVVTGGGSDYSDWGATIAGVVTAADTPDTWIRVSGVNDGDWIYQSAISFQSLNSSDPLQLPENIYFDDGGAGGAASGAVRVTVIPEPATIGLMGIAGLGMFLARRKARR